MSEPIRCACVANDPYDCWARRYRLPPDFSFGEIEDDGGPCECACHDYDEDYEDEP